ncbi:MAG TPA: NAD-dependent deacylase [Bacteroidota bacterium]|nr:NAD-dependent deacylase [Bacteroidota bacterium]
MTREISDTLTSRLREAHSIVAFTGAGISAESGVPTFRGADGIWAKLRPEELASMDGFLKNPSLVWEWYAHRKRIISAIHPNAGHYALVEMEKQTPQFAVITQNIDNLHRRAGSKTVYELHGNIERNYCMKCGKTFADAFVLAVAGLPKCDSCGGMVRPDVVWFGEMLPEEEWESSVAAAEGADLFLSIGTSAVVYPAASLPLLARRADAYVVEINPEPTPITDKVDEFLDGPSGEVLPMLVRVMERERGGSGAAAHG